MRRCTWAGMHPLVRRERMYLRWAQLISCHSKKAPQQSSVPCYSPPIRTFFLVVIIIVVILIVLILWHKALKAGLVEKGRLDHIRFTKSNYIHLIGLDKDSLCRFVPSARAPPLPSPPQPHHPTLANPTTERVCRSARLLCIGVGLPDYSCLRV